MPPLSPPYAAQLRPSPYKKLADLPAGVFLRGLTWSPDGSSFTVGRYQTAGDIFLAERSTSR